MNIKKLVPAHLEKCYAVRTFPVDGKLRYLFASEVRAGCVSFDAETLEQETVWENAGGTMGMVPLPGRSGVFLAIQGFYPPFLAKDSQLVLVTRGENGYTVEPYLSVPYLHRFGIVTTDRGSWLVLSVLCDGKKDKDDWSSPGHVDVCPIVNGVPGERVRLLGGQFRNHGFYSGPFKGNEAVLIGSDCGVFALTAPHGAEAEWKTEQLTDEPAGEVWPADMDGDGEEELVTLEAFHGTMLKVRHRSENGTYGTVWQYQKPLAFVHPLWVGELWGRMRCVTGARREDAPLMLLWYENGAYRTEIIEEGASPANVTVSEYKGKQCILSANHGRNECAIYYNEE